MRKLETTANRLAMSIIQVAQQLAAYIGTKRKESELNRQTLEAMNLVPEIQQEVYLLFYRYPLFRAKSPLPCSRIGYPIS